MVSTAVTQTLTENQPDINLTIQRQLTDGTKSVNNITRDATLWKGMTQRELIYNLYCAGADSSEIVSAAKSNGIPDESLVEGYNDAVQWCNVGIFDLAATLPSPAGSFISK